MPPQKRQNVVVRFFLFEEKYERQHSNLFNFGLFAAGVINSFVFTTLMNSPTHTSVCISYAKQYTQFCFKECFFLPMTKTLMYLFYFFGTPRFFLHLFAFQIHRYNKTYLFSSNLLILCACSINAFFEF